MSVIANNSGKPTPKRVDPNLNLQKEDFSLAYAIAVCAAAEYTVQFKRRDIGSVDISVHPFDRDWPQISLQLKCTAEWELFDGTGNTTPDTEISYDLPVKNYEELRNSTVGIQKALVLVVVPRDFKQWLLQSEKNLTLHHCGFWMCLQNMPPTTNLYTQRIKIPKRQVFGVDALKDLMAQVEQGKNLCS